MIIPKTVRYNSENLATPYLTERPFVHSKQDGFNGFAVCNYIEFLN